MTLIAQLQFPEEIRKPEFTKEFWTKKKEILRGLRENMKRKPTNMMEAHYKAAKGEKEQFG